MKEKDREDIEYKIAQMTASGHNVWAIGYTEKRKKTGVEVYTLLGLVGIQDPPKPGVKENIQELIQSGVKFAIVSEEGEGNAVQFARQMGILTKKSKAIICDQLTYLRLSERRDVIKNTTVFSESNAGYEKLIIKELKAAGEKVIFIEAFGIRTEALKEADISLALESSADILKLNADGIILGDRLDNISEAIEEARALTKSVERAFYSLFTSDMAIVFVVLLSSVILAGNTMNVQQILLVNLIADVMIGIGLAFDRTYVNEVRKPMKRKFPSTTENSFALLLAVYVAIAAIVVHLGVGAVVGATAVFAMLVLSFITITFSFISIDDSVLTTLRRVSPRILTAAAVSIIILLAVIYIGPLRDIFGLKELSLNNWTVIIAAAIGLPIVVEIKKGLMKLLKKTVSKR